MSLFSRKGRKDIVGPLPLCVKKMSRKSRKVVPVAGGHSGSKAKIWAVELP